MFKGEGKHFLGPLLVLVGEEQDKVPEGLAHALVDDPRIDSDREHSVQRAHQQEEQRRMEGGVDGDEGVLEVQHLWLPQGELVLAQDLGGVLRVAPEVDDGRHVEPGLLELGEGFQRSVLPWIDE
ncbi:hypothetical protein C0J52_04194 [Blattella germanica]|nr:hypothetical protein C0J52_04194 [Blattella germanica]